MTADPPRRAFTAACAGVAPADAPAFSAARLAAAAAAAGFFRRLDRS